jgi:L-amino acid N-acyltransferase YncA
MLVTAPPTVEVRALLPDDWSAVAEIYWDGLRGGLATFETEVPSWEAPRRGRRR